ncbi:chemotaxis protein CheW [uncultured Caulobacter sp.]|jgi:purine-binding chemotaxis protein CheW|uniref:chemotaxis protein CheW n=1 Tax=uncultured Caulobacter sp. TaxID=158749 RepID=UPI0026210D52|nr:chemotaxis protein CheW [uncultured Caulobacter sp.]
MIADMSQQSIEALTFDLRGETFALEAGLVREVLDLLPETVVPGAPSFVSSVINFRGRVIPLVDLRVAFEMDVAAPTIDSRIVVIEYDVAGEPMLIGLRADKVHEVTSIDRAITEDVPRVGLRWRSEFIQLLARRDGDVIIIPDLDRIFAVGAQVSSVVASPLPSLA